MNIETSRWRRVSVFAAMLLIVTGCAAEPPAPTLPAPSPTASGEASSAVATPAPAVPSAEPAFTWARATKLPVVPEESVVVAVAPVGKGFVAFSINGMGAPDIWYSPDGRAWETRAPPGNPLRGLSAVVAADGRLLAFGKVGDIDVYSAAVWTSDDGITWRRVQVGPEFDGAQVLDVAAAAGGFVAVGGVPGADAAAIWTSTSGETWKRASGQFAGAFLWAVARGGPGFVAVGWRRNPEPDLAVWTSVDGREWALAPEPPGGHGFQGRDVVARDGTLVMVGNLARGDVAGAWTSTDGVTWRPAEASASFDGSEMSRVIDTGSGLLAAGGRNVADAGVWTSSDGTAWEPVDDPVFVDAILTDATVVDGVVVLVGATQQRIGTESYTSAAMAWYGNIESR